MVRKRLIATVAVAPLLLFAGSAFAETTISNARTAGVRTSTVNNGAADDIKVTTGGSFALTTPGAAITMDAPTKSVNNEGGITTKNVDNAVGILVDTSAGPITGNLTNSGAITHNDDYTPKDDDKDGDDDGAYAQGTGKYGIRVTGANALTGNILNSGSITIEGNNSAAISVESDVFGTVRNYGNLTVTGDNAVGIRIAGDVSGGTTPLQRANGVFVSGSTGVRGVGAIGLDVSGDIGTVGDPAALVISGAISATGYRYTTRPFSKETRDKLDADDLLQGGPAVRVSGNVTGGIHMALPYARDFDGDGLVDTIDKDDDNDGKIDTEDTDDDNDGVLDADDKDFDNDGIPDATDGDNDNNGIPDANQGTSAIASYGDAPALLIASGTETITIGNVGTNVGNKDFGLFIQGSVTADGVFDNVNATAIQLGTAVDFDNNGKIEGAVEEAGYLVDLTGGARIDGSVSARSYNGDARGLWLRGDVNAPELLVDGAIVAIASSTSTTFAAEKQVEAVGIDISAASNVPKINVGGLISAGAAGDKASAIGIRDRSNSVAEITVTGVLATNAFANDDADDTDDDDLDPTNEPNTNRAIAIDLRENSVAATIVLNGKAPDGDDAQDGIADDDEDGDGVDDADEPSITGEILLGSGADVLDLRNGTLVGDMSFGLGNDKLLISGGATARGDILNLKGTEKPDTDPDANIDNSISRYDYINDLDDELDITVTDGRLTATNTSIVRGGTLDVKTAGELFVTINPDEIAGRQNTKFEFDTVNFANGSTIGFELTGLIDVDLETSKTYNIVKAGTLTFGDVQNGVDLENTPYFYTVETQANVPAGEVNLVVQRRDADSLGLEGSQRPALDAIYQALFADDELADAFLSATNKKDFLKLYDQMLPDQGEGLFSSLDNASQALFRLTATRPDMGQKYGPDSLWVQEINVGVLRETGVTIGSETKAFGFIGGYESMDDQGGALGATLAYMNAEEKDDVAQVGEQTNVSLLEAGVYWRRNVGGWLFAARGAAGYGWFEGQRRFIDPATSTNAGVIREVEANWGGFTGSANAMVAYEARFGRFYVRPQVSLDYLYLAEGERDEEGDIGLGVTVEDRTSSRLSAAAELAFGATFGRDNWWRPEIRVGYRQHLAGEIGDTTARFQNGNPFTLVATEPGDGAVIVGFSLKAGTPMSYVAVEGDLETAEGEDRYNLRLAGRMMF